MSTGRIKSDRPKLLIVILVKYSNLVRLFHSLVIKRQLQGSKVQTLGTHWRQPKAGGQTGSCKTIRSRSYATLVQSDLLNSDNNIELEYYLLGLKTYYSSYGGLGTGLSSAVPQSYDAQYLGQCDICLRMGVVVSSAKRAVRNWNATNRAIRYLEKTETKRKAALSGLRVEKNSNEYEMALVERDAQLEGRVTSFDITNERIKKSILPEGFDYVPKSSRKLPQVYLKCLDHRFEGGSPLPPPHIDFGFAIPEVIPKGKITMRQAINMIKSYQLKEKTVPQLADEYDLAVSVVASVCKYFALFERDASNVWVPPTESKDKKALLDAPIYQEDERLIDEGASRYTRPLTPLNRLIICGSRTLNQEGGTQNGLSSALQRFVNKNNDFLFSEYERLSKLVSSGRTELVDGSDTTLQELAAQEFTSRREEIRSLENRIMELLLPPDPTAQYSAVRLQLIAGAGGLEAAMFARDLFTMYAAYARYCGWQFASDDDGGATGAAVGADSPIHHVEVRVESSDPVDPVYPRLRWEAGVHRVQRVPLTSKLNKIHTSTVAVTILPVIDAAEVELDPEDLEWEVFRASGAGGQHVNKTESAVRVRHRPTGHVAACQADRSQHTNREAALKALRAKSMGLLARSDRIRTYNYQQDRITDHRLGRSWSGLATFMRQGFPVLDETALALDEAYKLNALASLDKPYFLC
uniref:Prokaryotic-type class I peptide chain release factors domain-containing protein n=1 Tax=Echinococcus canadensis TaxID=519352 RepID=A0A915EWB8_9CEST